MHYARLHPATNREHLRLPEPASSDRPESRAAHLPTGVATHHARLRPVLRERLSFPASAGCDGTGSVIIAASALQDSVRFAKPCEFPERHALEDSDDACRSDDSGCAEQAFEADDDDDPSSRDDRGEDEDSDSDSQTCNVHRPGPGEAIVPSLPMMLAVIRSGNLQMLQKLLLCGLDIGQADPYGHTVLTEVLRSENVLALQLLKPYLAKLEWSKRNRLFGDALDLAIADGNHLMVGVIGNAGGELKAFNRDE